MYACQILDKTVINVYSLEGKQLYVLKHGIVYFGWYWFIWYNSLALQNGTCRSNYSWYFYLD